MSSFEEIDINRKLTIWPCTRSVDGLIRAIPGEQIELAPGDGSVGFFTWLRQSPWASELESFLQCLSQTSEGELLLTTWLELDDFAALTAAATVVSWLQPQGTALARWRANGCALVNFTWFKGTQSTSDASTFQVRYGFSA